MVDKLTRQYKKRILGVRVTLLKLMMNSVLKDIKFISKTITTHVIFIEKFIPVIPFHITLIWNSMIKNN